MWKLIRWLWCVAILLGALLGSMSDGAAVADEPKVAQRWLDPRCKLLPIIKDGPFALDSDKSLLYLDGNQLVNSRDDGRTWTPRGTRIDADVRLRHVGHVGQFLRANDGTIVLVFLNFDGYKFEWNDELNEPQPTCRLELWSVRSTNGGKTWTDKQQLLPGYNADFMGFIQTSTGQLVATVEHLDVELKRWIVCSFVSNDLGQRWTRSNWIDLGGRGHHDGALEPCVVELRDGRLLMLIRTNLDRFWRAISSDAGLNWRIIEPTDIDASTAPAWLARLASGRLALIWNRVNSERKGEWPRTQRSPSFSVDTPSWHREELSLAFSDDEGGHWTKPQVVAHEDGGALAYPYLFEREPGVLWVFSRFPRKSVPPLALEIQEEEFVK